VAYDAKRLTWKSGQQQIVVRNGIFIHGFYIAVGAIAEITLIGCLAMFVNVRGKLTNWFEAVLRRSALNRDPKAANAAKQINVAESLKTVFAVAVVHFLIQIITKQDSRAISKAASQAKIRLLIRVPTRAKPANHRVAVADLLGGLASDSSKSFFASNCHWPSVSAGASGIHAKSNRLRKPRAEILGKQSPGCPPQANFVASHRFCSSAKWRQILIQSLYYLWILRRP